MTKLIVPTLVMLALIPALRVDGQEELPEPTPQTAEPETTEPAPAEPTSIPQTDDPEKADDLQGAADAEQTDGAVQTDGADKAADVSDDSVPHPLERALEFARKHEAFIRDHVRDFTCVLAKRERLNGRLHGYEYLRTRVLRERTTGEQTIPFSVYVEYLAPEKFKGRKVLFVDGRNENKMLVRKGGLRFGHVIVNVSPTSDAARRESRYPITELGLSNVVSRLLEQAKHDMIADPEAKNTEVEFYRNAKIDGRSCTHIRVTHPEKDDIFTFQQANIYVDDELNVPLRVETYTWPKHEGEPALLLEEYTYMKLKLNIGLTDSDFSEELVRAAAK